MTIASGQIVDADDLEPIVDPPAAVLRKSSDQAISPSTDTLVTWGVAVLDTHGGWDSGTPSRYTAPLDGWYEVAAHVLWAANNTDRRSAQLRLNGNAVIGSRQIIWPATSEAAQNVAYAPLLRMEVGDYVEARVRQATSGNLNVQSGENEAASVMYVYYRRGL